MCLVPTRSAPTRSAGRYDFMSRVPYGYKAVPDADFPAESLVDFIGAQMKPEFDWKDAEWLCSEWGDVGPVALKGVARVGDATALPAVIRRYSGKPVLMASSSVFGDRRGVVSVARRGDCLEFQLDVGRDFSHSSNYALFDLLPRLPSLVLDLAWLVEGRADADLPETLLAGLRLKGLDLARAVDADAWMGGDA